MEQLFPIYFDLSCVCPRYASGPARTENGRLGPPNEGGIDPKNYGTNTREPGIETKGGLEES